MLTRSLLVAAFGLGLAAAETRTIGECTYQVPDQVCAATQVATFDTKTRCFSCLCPRPKEAAPCPEPPVCATGVTPTRQKSNNCCPSCKPPRLEDLCTEEQRDMCKDKLEDKTDTTIRICPTGEKPMFNATTCCINCKLPPQTQCSEDTVKTCLQSAPTCTQDMMFVRREDRCCPDCLPPARKCELQAIAECAKDIPHCNLSTFANQGRELAAEGDCCPSCKPPKPECNPACTEGFFCAWRRKRREYRNESIELEPVCINGTKACLFFKKAAAAGKTLTYMEQYNTENVRAEVEEAMQRYCDTNPATCAKYKYALQSFQVKEFMWNKAKAIGKLCYQIADQEEECDEEADDPPSDDRRRRALAQTTTPSTTTPSQVVEEAIASNMGTVVADGNGQNAAAMNSPSALVLLMLGLLIAILG